ncbi:MAG TPA: PaaI family thioesterase [Pyrinomonadaceae bacterium]|nr:PaaI family thioesterase [Pyrinomonadaceae bacterium]
MPDQEITEEHKRRTADAINRLPLSGLLGMEFVDLQMGEAVLKIEMRDDLRQPFGVLHGGVTATLIDTAMAFAIRTMLNDTEPTASIDLTIHYLRPHTAGPAICTAKVVRPGKRIFTVSAEVANGEGKLVATALSTYTKF